MRQSPHTSFIDRNRAPLPQTARGSFFANFTVICYNEGVFIDPMKRRSHAYHRPRNQTKFLPLAGETQPQALHQAHARALDPRLHHLPCRVHRSRSRRPRRECRHSPSERGPAQTALVPSAGRISCPAAVSHSVLYADDTASARSGPVGVLRPREPDPADQSWTDALSHLCRRNTRCERLRL